MIRTSKAGIRMNSGILCALLMVWFIKNNSLKSNFNFKLKFILLKSVPFRGCDRFHLSCLAGPPCQFLNGTHEFRSRSGRPKHGNLGSCGRNKCARTSWTFPFKLARTSSFRPARTGKWKTTLDDIRYLPRNFNSVN